MRRLAVALAEHGAHEVGLRQAQEALAGALPRDLGPAIRAGDVAGGDDECRFALRAGGVRYGSLVVRERPTEQDRAVLQAAAAILGLALRAAEQERIAAEAATAREQFLAIVSHELRTPLHAILGYLEVLQMQLEPSGIDPEVADSLDRLRANAMRLNDLVQQIILFAELRSGRRVVNPGTVRIDRLIEQLGQEARQWIADRPIDVRLHVAADAREIVTDGPRLRQVLVCLLENAVKFTERGHVGLSARAAGEGRVEILVEDTGIGIAPSDREKIFEDFRQLDGSVTRRFGGVGIGLALARDLTRALGGVLELESEPGVGTRVVLRLPRVLDATTTTATVVAAARAVPA